MGRHLAEILSGKQHNICVIDSSATVSNDLNDQLDVHSVVGEGSSASTLAEANAPEADLFLGLTGDDNLNLVSASAAHAMGARKTIARVHPGLQREEWLFDYRSHFGIDYLFSSERLAAVELAKFVRNPQGLLVEEFARGRVELQQVHVAGTSNAVGQALQSLDWPSRVRVALIQRDNGNIVPSRTETLEAGDLVTLFGDPLGLQEAVQTLKPRAIRNVHTKVVIFGGGEYAFALAQMLEGANYHVRLIERDQARCEELSNTLLRSVVIHGDATSLSQLREEQVGDVDFFIGTTNDDEDNVMACLQAKNLGAKYALTLIHRADYAAVITQNSEQLGIFGAISPRVTAARDLLRFVTSDQFHVVVRLAGGLEILECPIADSAGVVGKSVSASQWPDGSGLVALQQGNQAFVPTGDDVIREGDTVYAIVSPEAKQGFIELLRAK